VTEIKPEAAAVEVPPMMEMIILAGDTRPVVVIMAGDFNKTGEVMFSNGPVEDIALVQWVCRFVLDAAADQLFERLNERIRDFSPVEERGEVDPDDIPF